MRETKKGDEVVVNAMRGINVRYQGEYKQENRQTKPGENSFT